MVTDRQISVVQDTWAQVVPIQDKAAELFYGKLFELDPALEPLFSGDMAEQGKKLTAMIGVAVKGLRKLDTVVPAVQALGRRHVGYGVRTEHYDTVAQALLWTLEQGLGPAYTDEAEEAWTAVYGLLSSVMLEAAAEEGA